MGLEASAEGSTGIILNQWIMQPKQGDCFHLGTFPKKTLLGEAG